MEATDTEENLIVLCPNCHQHRYHRSGEFTRDQIRLYKTRLKESNEIERRLLLNLEDIRSRIGELTTRELAQQLKTELSEAITLISPGRSPNMHRTIVETANDLANRGELLGGARKAIEIHFEVERQQSKAQFTRIEIMRADEDALHKSHEFPDAFKFELVLNQIPQRDWIDVFDDMYRRNWHNMKRETKIVRDRIQIIVGSSDNLQVQLDFTQRLVSQTNDFVFTQGFAEIDNRINAAKRRALSEYDAIQSLKERTRKLNL